MHRRNLLTASSALALMATSAAMALPLVGQMSLRSMGGAPQSKPSNIMSQQWSGVPSISNGSPFTLAEYVTCDAPFDAVRLVFLNPSTTPGTITSAAVNVSAALNDTFTPVSESGASLNSSWVNVTFNNGGADIPLHRQLQPPVSGASIYVAGTGGTTGTFNVIVQGTIGARAPIINVTIAAGAISAVNYVVDAGACAFIPGVPFVAGGGLVGARLTLSTASITGATVPPGTGTQFSSEPFFSDWIIIPGGSLPRTDGGTGYLLFSRVYIGSGTLNGPESTGLQTVPITGATLGAGGSGYLGGGNGTAYLVVSGLAGFVSNGGPPVAKVAVTSGVVTAITGFTPACWVPSSSITGTPLSTTPLQGGSGSGCTLIMQQGTSSIKALSGRDWGQSYSSGDAVTTPTSYAIAGWGVACVSAYQFVTETPGYTIAMIGDSIGQGLKSSGLVGILARATIAASTPAAPMSFVNLAQEAEPSSLFLENALRRLTAMRPSVLVAQVWSGNDIGGNFTVPGQAAAADTCWANFSRIADYAMRTLGIPVIAVGPVPQPTLCTTSALDATRLAADARAQNWAQAFGAGYLSLNSLLGDGSSPVNYQLQFDGGDNQHLNDAAEAAAAAALVPLLKQACGIVS